MERARDEKGKGSGALPTPLSFGGALWGLQAKVLADLLPQGVQFLFGARHFVSDPP